MATKTVGQLISELLKFPPHALAHAYEGESCGITVTVATGDPNEGTYKLTQGFIQAMDDDEDHFDVRDTDMGDFPRPDLQIGDQVLWERTPGVRRAKGEVYAVQHLVSVRPHGVKVEPFRVYVESLEKGDDGCYAVEADCVERKRDVHEDHPEPAEGTTTTLPGRTKRALGMVADWVTNRGTAIRRFKKVCRRRNK